MKPGEWRIILTESPEKPGTWSVQVECTKEHPEPGELPDAGHIGMILLGTAEVVIRKFVNEVRKQDNERSNLALPQGLGGSPIPPALLDQILRSAKGKPSGTPPAPPVPPPTPHLPPGP